MRIVFIGTGAIGMPVVKMLREKHHLVGVVTQPDKPAGRTQRLTPPPIKQALAETAIPILQPPRVRDETAIISIRELTPDVIVAMAYGQILPKSVLEIPRLGCLNLHASLLPRWRGATPIQAAIAAGDARTGITVMYMDEGLDTGDILLKTEIDIAPDETGGSLGHRLARTAPDVLCDALELLGKGNPPRIKQDNALATYTRKLERADGKIDWHESAVVIERKIRAFNPWPGTFTTVRDAHGERVLKIFRAAVVPEDQRGLVFETGNGTLKLLEVQLESSRRMTAEEFLRGHPRFTLSF
jgi:methionyl-tRNA formyltransferase